MAIDAGTIYSDVRIKLDKLSGDIQKVDAKLDQLGNQNKKRSGEFQNSWENAFSAINISAVAVFAAIGLAVKKSIEIFAQFEQSMANVKAVTGATGEEFQILQDAALEAGQTTRFTASQAADALYELASAGLDATQSAESLNSVLLLAGATGADLATTAKTVTATMSQFNIAAEDSTRISNVFAAAISNSQANIEKISSAFKQFGPVAGQFNISIEESTASLQALFNAGLQGEQAGTALRNILLDLSDKSGPVTKKLEELGIAFEDINPQKVGLTNAIEVLADSGIDLSQVFDKRVVPAILSLAKEGGAGLRELEQAVTDTDAAAEQYAIQNDTLQGSLDFLASAAETLAINFGSALAPEFKKLVDLVTDLINGINSFAKLLSDIDRTGKLDGIRDALNRSAKEGKDLTFEFTKIAQITGFTIQEIEEIAKTESEVLRVLEKQNKERQEAALLARSQATSTLRRALEESGILDVYNKQLQKLREIEEEQERLAEQEERKRTLEVINERVNEEIEILKTRKKIFGDTIDFQLEKEKIYQKALEEAIEKGYKPQETIVKNLQTEYEKLYNLRIQREKEAKEETKKTNEETKKSTTNLWSTISNIFTDTKDKSKSIWEEMLDDFEIINDQMLEIHKETLKKIEEEEEKRKQSYKEYSKSIATNFISTIGGIAGSIGQIFDIANQQRLDELDQRLQAELEAAGLLKETEEDRLKAELEAAREAGDTEAELQAQNDLRRIEIEREYERERAKLKYQGELQQWRITLSQGIASAASAVISGFASKPFIPVGIAAGVSAGIASGIQLAAIRKAKPDPPSFQTGGIVLPSGTKQGTAVNVAEGGSSELLLNNSASGKDMLRQFAKEIARELKGNNNNNNIGYFQLSIDGKKLSEIMANYYNNGITRINL